MKHDSKGPAAWDAGRGDRLYVGLDAHTATITVAVVAAPPTP
jgi:hypothetical protein